MHVLVAFEKGLHRSRLVGPIGLMVGDELALSAFVNPAIWHLESGSQAQGLSLLARSLGRVMPVWYGLCPGLLTLESFLHRHHCRHGREAYAS
jgi:hypothetical protein